MKLRVATAAGSGAPWESALTRASQQPGSGVEVVRRCYDLHELVAMATGGEIDVALVAADVRGLDLSQVEQLTATGVAVVGVAKPGDDTAEQRLRQLGLVHVVAEDAAPDRIAETAAYAAAAPAAATGRELALRERGGSVLAVWGPKGAPGRTTIAVNLAYEIARLTDDVLLVDADTYGGAVAVTLGISDAPSDLAQVAQLADQGTLDVLRLRALTQLAMPGPRVLTGLPGAGAWTAVYPATWELLLGLFRQSFPLTVVDVAPYLDEDEDLAYDNVTLRRNAVTRRTLQDADLVIATVRADPVGLHQFITAYQDLLDLDVSADRVCTVVNQVRADRFAGEHQAEVRSELIQQLGVEPVAYIPYDRRALDQATSSTRALAEVSGWSPIGREITCLARTLTNTQPARPSRRGASWLDRLARILRWQVQPS